jgi:hypothetical protein
VALAFDEFGVTPAQGRRIVRCERVSMRGTHREGAYSSPVFPHYSPEAHFGALKRCG